MPIGAQSITTADLIRLLFFELLFVFRGRCLDVRRICGISAYHH